MAYHFDTFDNIDEFAIALIHHVGKEKISITWKVEPEHKEVQIEPWEPYTPICPYASENRKRGKNKDK